MDFNRKLIDLVKIHKAIYDSNDPKYSDTAHKSAAWKDISSRLQVSEKECKKSWMLLREGYRRTLKKKKASESDPVIRKDKDVRKWTYEDDLSFLSLHLKQFGPRSYVKISTNNNNTSVGDYHPEMANEGNTPASTPDVSAQKRATLKRGRAQEAVARRSCSHEITSTNLIKYVLEKTTKRSDIQQFFDSIACTVQTFSPRDRAIAKRKVFEVISQMELQVLDQNLTPSFHNSRESDDMEVTESRSCSYPTQPPEGPTAGLLESNSEDDDDDAELVLNIKVEPEQYLGLNIKQEPYT